jgi:hypothetical protein
LTLQIGQAARRLLIGARMRNIRVRSGAALVVGGSFFLLVPHSFGVNAKNGQGNMTVSPTAVTAHSTNSFSFSFRVNKKTFNAGSAATVSVPAGWSAPQTNNPSAPGYVTVAPVMSGSTASLQAISGTGPWLLTINFSTSQNQAGFNLGYQAACAPTNGGVYSFTSQSKQSGGTFIVLRSGSPTLTVNNPADSNTVTSISSALNPSVYGQWVTFTGVVSSVSSPRVPTGTLTFKQGDVVLATVNLNNQAFATFATNRFSVPDSPDWITAVYSGDTNFNPSVSAILQQTVNPATATLTGLAAQNKVYDGGTAALLNTSNVSLGGILAGDSVTLDISAATATFADQNVGTSKTVSVAGLALAGTDSGNYVVTTNATLSANILPAPLVVTANDTNRLFGAANPTFTASYSGFVAGENQLVLSGAPAFNTTANASSVAGPYTISLTNGTLAAANYSFSFVPGRLTIVPGPGQPQQIVSIIKAVDGTVTLICGGAAGQPYVLQASSNLSSGPWTALLTNATDIKGWMTCIDQSATNASRRFYRTSLP